MNAIPAPPEPPEPGSEAAQTYFRLLEEAFLRLRGAALLLGPADWQAARRWHQLGIPVELVIDTMTMVWRRRLERGGGSGRRINSLRYFAPAVEAAWEEVAQLGAAGRHSPEPPIDAATRLERLSDALPASLPDRAAWSNRIRDLRGTHQGIEERLGEIEREIAQAAERRLRSDDRADLAARAERRLGPLASRLSREQLAEARHRLLEQELRRAIGLPVLSLFSPAARDGD